MIRITSSRSQAARGLAARAWPLSVMRWKACSMPAAPSAAQAAPADGSADERIAKRHRGNEPPQPSHPACGVQARDVLWPAGPPPTLRGPAGRNRFSFRMCR